MLVNSIAQSLTYFIAMLLALTFHEAAHAVVAYMRGDRTAYAEGRLSLNPAAHADLVGTIILPLVGFLMHMPIIGWAKPVPVDERSFKNPVVDGFFVGMAGPFSNLLMALISVISLRVYQVYGGDIISEGSLLYPLIKLLVAFAFVNATLAFFNLLPLPPLDGSSLLRLMLPQDLFEKFEQTIAPYSFVVLLLLATSGGLSWIGKIASIYIGVCNAIATIVLPGVA